MTENTDSKRIKPQKWLRIRHKGLFESSETLSSVREYEFPKNKKNVYVCLWIKMLNSSETYDHLPLSLNREIDYYSYRKVCVLYTSLLTTKQIIDINLTEYCIYFSVWY
jgi:hypothetical protein